MAFLEGGKPEGSHAADKERVVQPGWSISEFQATVVRMVFIDSPRRQRLLLIVAVALAYANALAGPFQFDDWNIIAENPAVHSWATWWHYMPGIRPLLKATYTANWTSGAGTVGFHVVNVALHAINALLVREIVVALAPRLGLGSMVPMVAALVFALHPAQTEAVTYVSGRSVSLMALFLLLSVWFHLVAEERESPWRWRVLSVASFAIALAAKENAWALPFALVLCEAVRPDFRWRSALRVTAGHWAVLVLLAVVVFSVPAFWRLLGNSLDTRSLGDNLLTQVDGMWYLVTCVLTGWVQNIDPDLPIQTQWTTSLAIHCSVLLAVLAFGISQLRSRSWLGFGIVWFFVLLLPTNTILPRIDVANDRQLYLPLIGPAIIVAVAIDRWLPRRWSMAGVVALCLVLGSLTIVRNQDYASESALWRSTARHSPDKGRVWNNLGYSLEREGALDEARVAYRQAIALDPADFRAQMNLDRIGQ